MASIMALKISSSYWVNWNEINSICLTAVYVVLCSTNVRLNQNVSGNLLIFFMGFNYNILQDTRKIRNTLCYVTPYQLLSLHMSTGLLKNELYLNFCSVNNQARRVVHEHLRQVSYRKVFRILPPRLKKPRGGSGRGNI